MLIVAGITYLSLASGDGLPKTDIHFENADKLVHFCMYGALAAVLGWDLLRNHTNRTLTGIITCLAGILYGGLIELVQPYFPPRTCELGDWLADIAGILIGYIIIDILWKTTHSSIK